MIDWLLKNILNKCSLRAEELKIDSCFRVLSDAIYAPHQARPSRNWLDETGTKQVTLSRNCYAALKSSRVTISNKSGLELEQN